MKTLGAFIRFIPVRDQKTIAAAVSASRNAEIHRGMLVFIPIDEIEKALRDRNENYDHIGAAQLQQAYQNQLEQVYQSQLHYPYSLGTSGGIGGFGGGLWPTGQALTPTGIYPSQTPAQKYHFPSIQDCQFAYSALLVAKAMMIQTNELLEDEPEESHDSQNNPETKLTSTVL